MEFILSGCVDYCDLEIFINDEISNLDLDNMKKELNEQKKIVNQNYKQLAQIINPD